MKSNSQMQNSTDKTNKHISIIKFHSVIKQEHLPNESLWIIVGIPDNIFIEEHI